MTFEEVYGNYVLVFEACIKAAGQQADNPAYKNVKQILEREEIKEAIGRAVNDEVELEIFITLLLYGLLREIHGVNKLKTKEPEEIAKLLSFIYTNYLKKATEKFCQKYGLEPPPESLDTFFTIKQYRLKA